MSTCAALRKPPVQACYSHARKAKSVRDSNDETCHAGNTVFRVRTRLSPGICRRCFASCEVAMMDFSCSSRLRHGDERPSLRGATEGAQKCDCPSCQCAAWRRALPCRANQNDDPRVPHPHEGRFAIVTDVGSGMRWTRCVTRRVTRRGRRNRVVLAPQGWR
jgi:hypothetical protein